MEAQSSPKKFFTIWVSSQVLFHRLEHPSKNGQIITGKMQLWALAHSSFLKMRINNKVSCIITILILLPLSLIITEIIRPSVNNNLLEGSIYQWLSDVGASLLTIPIICNVFWLTNIKVTHHKISDILVVSSIYILHEISSAFLPFLGTFDYNDIIALLIGLIISLVLLLISAKEDFLKEINHLSKSFG
ncbi:hypothetical protein [Ekhidna sp.]|uniref:hypothetical protein n=1 Tax=Ekhidna sp. TaxID=2608089 RepID=UPI003B5C9DFE